MALTPENAKRADRALRAISINNPALASFPGIQHHATGGLVRLLADCLHLCDRYDLDASTLLAAATQRYLDELPDCDVPAANAKVEAMSDVSLDYRNYHSEIARRMRRSAQSMGPADRGNPFTDDGGMSALY
jgi:hypothetical protein